MNDPREITGNAKLLPLYGCKCKYVLILYV